MFHTMGLYPDLTQVVNTCIILEMNCCHMRLVHIFNSLRMQCVDQKIAATQNVEHCVAQDNKCCIMKCSTAMTMNAKNSHSARC